jgi:hypothetical protein
VAVLDAVGGLLLHLGEHIADDLGVVVGGLLRAGDVDGHVRQLRPRERVVQVVLEEVVLGQVLEVGVLDQRDVRRSEDADIHRVGVLEGRGGGGVVSEGPGVEGQGVVVGG